jgi:hypothetical protein
MKMTHYPQVKPLPGFAEEWYKAGPQIGTQKSVELAVQAVDAVHAVRIFLRIFSAC